MSACGVRIVEFGNGQFLACTRPFGHVGEHQHTNPRWFYLPEAAEKFSEIIMDEHSENRLKAAAKKVSDALQDLLDNKDDFLADTNEVCAALEDLCHEVGVPSLCVVKLRKELAKRGMRR